MMGFPQIHDGLFGFYIVKAMNNVQEDRDVTTVYLVLISYFGILAMRLINYTCH